MMRHRSTALALLSALGVLLATSAQHFAAIQNSSRARPLPPRRQLQPTTTAKCAACANASQAAFGAMRGLESEAPGDDFLGVDKKPFYRADGFLASLENAGELGRVHRLRRKIQSCTATNDVWVNIAIFGGSETAGNQCSKTPCYNDACVSPARLAEGHFDGSGLYLVPPTDHCPWAEPLRRWMKQAHPACHFDVYNLARGGTSVKMASQNLHAWLWSGRSRDGRLLKDSVDLVVVDYGVNDGYIHADGTYDTSHKEEADNRPGVEAVVTAATEVFTRQLLSLAALPAVVFLETTDPTSLLGIGTQIAHGKVARFYSVPSVSVINLALRSSPEGVSNATKDEMLKSFRCPVCARALGTAVLPSFLDPLTASSVALSLIHCLHRPPPLS